jgi:hypothetical protein
VPDPRREPDPLERALDPPAALAAGQPPVAQYDLVSQMPACSVNSAIARRSRVVTGSAGSLSSWTISSMSSRIRRIVGWSRSEVWLRSRKCMIS